MCSWCRDICNSLCDQLDMAENVQQLREQQKDVLRQQETSVSEVLTQWNDHDVSLKSALDQIAAEVQNVAEEAQSQLEAGRDTIVTVRTERNRYLQAAKELEAELEEQALAMLAEETAKPATISRTASNDAKDGPTAVPLAASTQPSALSSVSALPLPPQPPQPPNEEPTAVVAESNASRRPAKTSSRTGSKASKASKKKQSAKAKKSRSSRKRARSSSSSSDASTASATATATDESDADSVSSTASSSSSSSSSTSSSADKARRHRKSSRKTSASSSTSDRRKASKTSKESKAQGRRSSKRSSTEPAPLTREQKELLRQRLLDEELLDAVTQTQAALGEMLLRAGSSASGGDHGAGLSLTATSTSATAATASQWELQLRLAEEKITALIAEKKQLEQRVKTQQKDFDGQHRAKWRLIQELEAKNSELDRLVVQLSSSSQTQAQSQPQLQQAADVSPLSPGDDRSDDQHTLSGSRDELSHLLFSPPPPLPQQQQQPQQRRPSSVASNGAVTAAARSKSTQSFAQQTSFHSQQQLQTTTTTTATMTSVSRSGSRSQLTAVPSTAHVAADTSVYAAVNANANANVNGSSFLSHISTAHGDAHGDGRTIDGGNDIDGDVNDDDDDEHTAAQFAQDDSDELLAMERIDAASDPPPRHAVSFRDPAVSAARAALGEYEYEAGEGDEEDVHVVASLDDFHVEMASASASSSSMRRNSRTDAAAATTAASVEELLLGGGSSRRADRPPRPPSTSSASRLATAVGGSGDGSVESKSGHDQYPDGIDPGAAVDELRLMLHDVETQKEALVVQLRDLEHEREHWQLETTTAQHEQRQLRKENDDLAKDNLVRHTASCPLPVCPYLTPTVSVSVSVYR